MTTSNVLIREGGTLTEARSESEATENECSIEILINNEFAAIVLLQCSCTKAQ